MSQTISVTQARDNFPALVRQVAEQDTAMVVTSRNQPRVVLVRWETYQQQQQFQHEAAEHRLQTLVPEMLTLAATLQETYRPHSYDLIHGTQELQVLARQAWLISRFLDKPRRLLATAISDALLNLEGDTLSLAQLAQLIHILPLLQRKTLPLSAVAEADRTLHAVGLNGMPTIEDDLVSLYG